MPDIKTEKTAASTSTTAMTSAAVANQETFFVQQQQALDAWKKVVDEQIARMGSMYEEMAKFEGKGVEQARNAIDEFSKLMKESLSYATQYTGEWRKAVLEASRRTAEMMKPRN